MGEPTGTVSVRAASPDDASALAALLGELGYPAEVESVRTRMARMVVAGGSPVTDFIFVASLDDDDEAVGFLSVHRFSALHADADNALITALVVTERARGLGVGRQLVDRAVEAARAWSCTRLLVTTHVRRADAHAFYERLGFEFSGRRYARAL